MAEAKWARAEWREKSREVVGWCLVGGGVDPNGPWESTLEENSPCDAPGWPYLHFPIIVWRLPQNVSFLLLFYTISKSQTIRQEADLSLCYLWASPHLWQQEMGADFLQVTKEPTTGEGFLRSYALGIYLDSVSSLYLAGVPYLVHFTLHCLLSRNRWPWLCSASGHNHSCTFDRPLSFSPPPSLFLTYLFLFDCTES